MKKRTLLFILSFYAHNFFAQTVYLNGGTSISKMNWEFSTVFGYNETHAGKSIVGPSVFAGLRYLEEKRYFMSTEIGYLRKGSDFSPDGGSGNTLVQFDDEIAFINYYSINTSFNLKPINKDKFALYIFTGPRVDIKDKTSKHFDSYYDDTYHVGKVNVGFNGGFGAWYNVNSSLVMGTNIQYLFNLNKIVEWEPGYDMFGNEVPGWDLADRTFSAHLSIGYKLK